MRQARNILFGLFLSIAAGSAGIAADTPAKTVTADSETKVLLPLMDQDRTGKVSREEFMNFVASEFERLDITEDGELDVQELTGPRARRSPANRGSK